MITDTKRYRMDAVADSQKWRGLFDVVAVSASVGGQKDEPGIFTYALNELRLRADECAFIDDRAHNLNVAANMGFITILLDNEKRDYAALKNRLNELLGINL